MASNTASSFQVTGAREIAARCDHGSASGTMGTNSQPMTERPPSTDQQPKGAPGEGAPPPEPHTMAMLQQPGTTDTGTMGSQTGSTTATSPSTSEGQTPGNGSMANTPVTSQTPAEPASPTGTNSQPGSGTSNPSSVSTQPAQTGAGPGGRVPRARIQAWASTTLTPGRLRLRVQRLRRRARRMTRTSRSTSGRRPTFRGPAIRVRPPRRPRQIPTGHQQRHETPQTEPHL